MLEEETQFYADGIDVTFPLMFRVGEKYFENILNFNLGISRDSARSMVHNIGTIIGNVWLLWETRRQRGQTGLARFQRKGFHYGLTVRC